MKVIRDEMFEKMQKLPIRFYDTRTNGEIMSYYTNDVDTLTEFISRGLPMIVRVLVTIAATFIAMCSTSIYLTALVLIVIFLMMKVTKRVGGKSADYFIKQQKSISKVDGYIEEMINGQKVIKVFSHEEEAINNFKKLNNELCNDMTNANIYSNVLGPMLANIGNLQFVLLGVFGGILAINGVRWTYNWNDSFFLEFKQKLYNANYSAFTSNKYCCHGFSWSKKNIWTN